MHIIRLYLIWCCLLYTSEMSKGLKIVKLTWEDESQVKFHTDGCEVSSGEFYFGGDDPQIIVDFVPENRKSIKIEMEILDRKTTEKKFWKVYAEQKRAMEQMSCLLYTSIISAMFVHAFFVLFTIILYAAYGKFPDFYYLQIIYYSVCVFILVLGLSLIHIS